MESRELVILSAIAEELRAAREPKSVAEMFGEILRDIGLLLLTFVPLDTVFEIKAVPTYLFWAGILWGLIFIILGVLLEKFK